MKVSFEISRAAAVAVRADTRRSGILTGAALTPPIPVMRPESIRAMRKLEEINERMQRSYDAAANTNYNADFRGTFGSPNTEIFPTKYTVRARARTLAKDTPHGKVVIRTFQNNVVGDEPFKLDMRIGDWKEVDGADGKKVKKFVLDEDANREIERQWKRFCRPENFTVRRTMSAMEAMRIMEASAARDGSILIREYNAFEFNEFGYALDLLEEDHLQETYQGTSPRDGAFGGGNPIRASIEYHPKYNFPLAFWVLTRHPGEFFSQSFITGGNTKLFREQIPASQIIHFNNLRDRAEQDIGQTELDATVQPLWRNHQYDKSLVIAAIASCIKPFVLEKKLPTGLQMPAELMEQFFGGNNPLGNASTGGGPGDGSIGGSSPDESQQNVGRKAQVLSPGMERVLDYGVEAKILDPKFPIEAAHEFRNDNLRDIAVGTGLSYQHVSGDFQNLGFIAGLMCQIPFQDYMKIRQNHMRDSAIIRIFRGWLKSSLLKGVFDFPTARLEEFVDAAHFKAKRWAFVNPLVQAQTLILMLEAGILSPQQVQDQLPDGVSIEDLYTQIAEAELEKEKHGLNFSGDATKPNQVEPGDEPPTAPESQDGGSADVPQKSKVNSRSRIPITALLAMSTNGEH